MPPRGRPPFSRGVFSFEDLQIAVPPRVVLDTSFVVEALVASQPLHRQCAEYLAELAEARAEVVFNHLLRAELCEVAFRLALKERHPRDWMRYRRDGRARLRAGRLMASALNAWDAALESFIWTEVSVAEVGGEVERLMRTYGIGSYDAVHAATALLTGVQVLVTIDVGFAAVPERELTLFVDRTRVRPCRARRAGQRR